MIGVIIVTYNRKLLLKECLESVFKQKINEKIEIIVIDNFSWDGTEDFVKNMFGDKIEFIKNKTRKSLMACKTLGINLASADKIAFIDDDCVASENWLNEIIKSLSTYDFVGGHTLPMSDIVFPWWWRKSLNWLVGINTKPNKKFLPLGGNIAFNKYVLTKLQEDERDNIIRYNTYLPYGEDNYRIKRAIACGFKMGINPNMIVYHRIPKERLKIAYLLKRSYGVGRALVNYENKPKNILLTLVFIFYNFIRLFISLDINRTFRIISNSSYILHYLKTKFIKKCKKL